MILEHNVETGEIIEREFTDAELKQINADVERAKIKDEEVANKISQRLEILSKLGLSEDEAKLLLG